MVLENHMLLWAIVGGVSGAVFGLAGTGGGVISIPILMSLGGYSIKEASGYGLLALTVGAAVSWFINRKNTVYPLVGVLVICAGTVAFITVPLKAVSPPWLVSLFLNLTCIFSLYSLWILRKPDDPGENLPLRRQIKTASVGGLMTGFLSTMTGLGGGVVIIPWLTGITRLRFDQAMACSLLTIAITAPFSAWRQNTLDLALGEWLALGGTIFVAAVLIKKGISYIPPSRLIILRKLTLTAVIFLSMSRTFSLFFE